MIGAAMFLGIILVGVTGFFYNEQRQEQNINVAKEVLISAESELFLASKVLPGYIREFDIPLKINNEDYEIIIDRDNIILTYSEIDFIGVAPNVTGNIAKGNNTIKNVEGRVCLNLPTC